MQGFIKKYAEGKFTILYDSPDENAKEIESAISRVVEIRANIYSDDIQNALSKLGLSKDEIDKIISSMKISDDTYLSDRKYY